jgi:hypothetical protein
MNTEEWPKYKKIRFVVGVGLVFVGLLVLGLIF